MRAAPEARADVCDRVEPHGDRAAVPRPHALRLVRLPNHSSADSESAEAAAGLPQTHDRGTGARKARRTSGRGDPAALGGARQTRQPPGRLPAHRGQPDRTVPRLRTGLRRDARSDCLGEASRPHAVLHCPVGRIGPALHRSAHRRTTPGRGSALPLRLGRFVHVAVGDARRTDPSRWEGRGVSSRAQPRLPAADQLAEPPQDSRRRWRVRVQRRLEHRRRIPRQEPELRLLARRILPHRRPGRRVATACLSGGLALCDGGSGARAGVHQGLDETTQRQHRAGGAFGAGQRLQGDSRNVLRGHPPRPQAGVDRQPVPRARSGAARCAHPRRPGRSGRASARSVPAG